MMRQSKWQKFLAPFAVLDNLCPTPSDRKGRMTIDARQERGCGIQDEGTQGPAVINHAAIRPNLAASRQAFRSETKAFSRLVCFAYFRLISLISLIFAWRWGRHVDRVIGNGDRPKPELQTGPKAVGKRQNEGFFTA